MLLKRLELILSVRRSKKHFFRGETMKEERNKIEQNYENLSYEESQLLWDGEWS